jgi:uronate dehydrogenase
MPTILITGAAGDVGTVLCEGLRQPGRTLKPTDRLLPAETGHAQNFTICDLGDLDAVVELTRGVDTIVHAAGIPDEAPFELLSHANMTLTYNIFEAARISGVRRVIYASSAHVVGMYKRGVPLTVNTPPAPDSMYAVTKLFGESVGAVYSAKHGIEVVNVRIGSFRPSPEDKRQLQTWLSHRDAVSLFDGAIEADVTGSVVIYGGSANTGRWWSEEGYDEFGFSPVDNAASFAPGVPDERFPSEWQGGVYSLPWYNGSGSFDHLAAGTDASRSASG